MPTVNLQTFVGGNVSSGTQLNAAIATLPAAGGVIFAPSEMTINITDVSVTLPDNVCLIGETSPIDHISLTPLGTYGPRININPGLFLTLRNSSMVKGFVILRNGFTFNNTAAQIAANWTGYGLRLADVTAGHIIRDCCIMGFEVAIRAAVGAINCSRHHFERINIDCKNGIVVQNSYDVSYLREVHCWPFSNAAAPAEPNNAQLKRPGSAFQFTGVHDGTRVTDCFSFGYFRGTHISNANGIHQSGVIHDYPGGTVPDSSIGFLVDGTTLETKLTGCGASAQDTGYFFNMAGATTTAILTGCNASEPMNNGYVFNDGHMLMANCIARKSAAVGTGIQRVGGGAGSLQVNGGKVFGFAASIVGATNVWP